MSTVTITGAAVVAQSAATTPTAGSGQLLTAVLVSIAVIIALITWLKLHPFLALVLGSALLAVLAGIPIANTFASFIKGLGATTGDVGVLIALGAMIGKLLADSGGADRVVDTILGRTAERRLPWAMALIAFVIGIPLFFEIGVVLLIPVVLLVALRARRSVIVVGIPALAGLSVLHGLVPPHPGPLIAVSALNASVGLTLGLGLLVAVPTVAIAGPLLAKPMARWVALEPPAELTPAPDEDAHPVRTPAFGWVLATILLPVVLMLGRTVTDSTLPQRNQVRVIADFVGSPLVALLVATLVAMVTLGRGAGFGRVRLQESIGSALPAHRRDPAHRRCRRRVQADPRRHRGRAGDRRRHAEPVHLGVGGRLVGRGVHPAGHRLGDGRDHHRSRDRRPARRRPGSGARRAAGAGRRRGLAVLQPCQRRGLLAGQGVLRHDGRADAAHLVGDGDG